MRSIGRSAQLVLVYCLVDDGLKAEKNGGNWRKSNHHPKCTDAEIIAVAMMQSYFGPAPLKRTYLLIKANDAKAFPILPNALLMRLAPYLLRFSHIPTSH